MHARRGADGRLQAAARDRQPRRSTSSAETPLIDIVARRHGRQHLNAAIKESLPDHHAAASPTSRARQPVLQPAGRNERGDGASVASAGRQQPLQQPADRRRGQQRPLRPGGRRRHARRHGRDAADQPRRDPGDPARRLAVRRPAGRLHRAAASTPSRRAAPNALQRHGVLLRPQPGLGRARASDRHEDSASSRTSRAAAASAARSCRTRRSSSATSDCEPQEHPVGLLGQRLAGSSSATSARDRSGHRHPENAVRLRSPGGPRRVHRRRPTTTSSSSAATSTCPRNQLTVRHNYSTR